MIKIAHVISGLNIGGAEMMLYRFLSVYDKNRYIPVVISLTDIGPIGQKIQALGIPVYACNMKNNFFRAPFILLKLLHKHKLDVIQTWMYHADLFGGIIGKLLNIPVVWGIHNSTLIKGKSKRGTIYIAMLNAYLSKFIPAQIICCSEIAQSVHEKLGYCSKKMKIIPNGFDCKLFSPDEKKRNDIRLKLQCEKDEFLIGMFARFDPQKDHQTLIKGAGIFFRKVLNAKLILCGDGLTYENKVLKKWIEQEGIKEKVVLLGRRDDIQDICKILDIFTLSSSFGEAFPLVVGEAMLTEVPCVVTDVGDSSSLVGDTGSVVPPVSPQALADAWLLLYEMDSVKRKDLGKAARRRIENNFELEKICKKYNDIYEIVKR